MEKIWKEFHYLEFFLHYYAIRGIILHAIIDTFLSHAQIKLSKMHIYD